MPAPDVPEAPAAPQPLPPVVPPLDLDQLGETIEAPSSGGVGGLLDRLRGSDARGGGGLLGLLIGGLS